MFYKDISHLLGRKLRIFTKPWAYIAHFELPISDSSEGTMYSCKVFPEPEPCEACVSGDKAVKRYWLGAMECGKSRPLMLDIGNRVYDLLKILNRTDDYGDPSRYDIQLVTSSDGDIVVVPSVPSPMDSKFQAIIDSAKHFKFESAPSPLSVVKCKFESDLHNYGMGQKMSYKVFEVKFS